MLSWLFYDLAFNNSASMSMSTFAPLREPTEQNAYVEAPLYALEAACAGLWELLKAKNGYSDEELIASIKDWDTKHPATQGKVGTVADVCPKCGHKMLTHNHTKCLWCGADIPANPF